MDGLTVICMMGFLMLGFHLWFMLLDDNDKRKKDSND